MTCAMRLHDPCAGEVRVKTIVGHEVPLCWRHVILWHKRATPFRWQTPKQLEQWAADRAWRQGAGARTMQHDTVNP